MTENFSVSEYLYTLEEAASILRVSRTTLWRVITSERLDTVPIGRRVFVSRQAVEAFILEAEGT